jgi:glycerol-3-phosphate dehydrogenase
MKRDLTRLANRTFDVLVVGGGIHGAVAAWDATLRGLSVALIERGDFGSATSQNSLKIIHGGLRYLQDGNLARIRTMARERTTWMKIAPHLVHPLTCLMPTRKKISRSRLAMRCV